MRSSSKRSARGGTPSSHPQQAAVVPATPPRRSLLRTALEPKHLPLTILTVLGIISVVSRVILLLR